MSPKKLPLKKNVVISINKIGDNKILVTQTNVGYLNLLTWFFIEKVFHYISFTKSRNTSLCFSKSMSGERETLAI